ncbi:hypothetical protein [Nocardia testacea]|uniref:hypothetical protein n=1 Tax=Nocardia testacea TaxID=248551 RepID=UPI0012F680C9|nr:hypothetical protein [Nocardia testacea]
MATADQSLELTQRCHNRVNNSASPREKSRTALTRAVALTRHGDLVEALELVQSSLTFLLAVSNGMVEIRAVQVRIWAQARLISDLLAAAPPREPN